MRLCSSTESRKTWIEIGLAENEEERRKLPWSLDDELYILSGCSIPWLVNNGAHNYISKDLLVEKRTKEYLPSNPGPYSFAAVRPPVVLIEVVCASFWCLNAIRVQSGCRFLYNQRRPSAANLYKKTKENRTRRRISQVQWAVIVAGSTSKLNSR